MRLEKVLQILRGLAPESLAEPWDKVGLQVSPAPVPAPGRGSRTAGKRAGGNAVTRGLLCIDLTEAVANEAAASRAQVIVAYHPPIFAPLARLSDEDWKGRALLTCIRHGIAVYSPHTALDAAPGGVNDWLAAGLGRGKIEAVPRAVSLPAGSPACKLVTFVPPQYADKVRTALARAGAGVIGQYTQCSFGLTGRGTFRGGEGAHPTLGKAGRLEQVEEVRLEMICPAATLEKAIAALRSVHPYEEPAFDVYDLRSPEPPQPGGAGRLMTLDSPVSLATLVGRIKRRLGVRYVELATPAGQPRKIRRIALCAGAGASVITQARSAEVLFTGEMRHHDVLAAVQEGKAVILAGHTQTERPYLETYRRRILAAGEGSGGNSGGNSGGVSWRVARSEKAPGRIA